MSLRSKYESWGDEKRAETELSGAALTAAGREKAVAQVNVCLQQSPGGQQAARAAASTPEELWFLLRSPPGGDGPGNPLVALVDLTQFGTYNMSTFPPAKALTSSTVSGKQRTESSQTGRNMEQMYASTALKLGLGYDAVQKLTPRGETRKFRLVGEEDIFCKIPQTQLRVLAYRTKSIRNTYWTTVCRVPFGQSGLRAICSISAKMKVLEILIASAKFHGVALFYTSGVRIKGHHADPRFVSVASRYDSTVHERPNCHQVILSSCHYVFPIGAPTHTQQSSKVAFHCTMQFHRVKVKHAKKTILAHARQELPIRGKGKFVQGTLTYCPFKQREEGRRSSDISIIVSSQCLVCRTLALLVISVSSVGGSDQTVYCHRAAHRVPTRSRSAEGPPRRL
ncbi:hypothetical protein EK904_009817 [Melospiza melodia maxima]|nr:hypothetical protein EK904_009817 [Melospiza melodia maxima]